jgi:hypothetical protein
VSHLDRLGHLLYPLKYDQQIRLNIEGDKYIFSAYNRDDYDCAFVYVDAYIPEEFLLRVQDGKILWGEFAVGWEILEKTIDGVIYKGKIETPTEWEEFKVDSPLIEKQLIEIIEYLIEGSKP